MALIEFDSSHDECLLTQVLALKNSNCWVVLVTNQTIRNRNGYLENLIDEWYDIDPRGVGLVGAAIRDALIIRRLMRRLKKDKTELVVFNTAQGGHVRNACLFSLFRPVEFVGIVHTIRKFQGSFTQRLICLKIKKYFVLAAFLKAQIPASKQSKVEWFYPINFPDFPVTYQSDEQSIHISIIGGVESRRKDLDGFVHLVGQCNSSVTFSFLGRSVSTHPDVIKLKKKLTKINRLDRVEFFDNYLKSETINQILRKTAAILALVHPTTSSSDEYFKNQIPGAMNIALGAKIPLLIHDSFRHIQELNTASVYYTLDHFSNALEEVKTDHLLIRKRMCSYENYRSEFQEKRYSEFLFESV